MGIVTKFSEFDNSTIKLCTDVQYKSNVQQLPLIAIGHSICDRRIGDKFDRRTYQSLSRGMHKFDVGTYLCPGGI
jgi:hypothetical protein